MRRVENKKRAKWKTTSGRWLGLGMGRKGSDIRASSGGFTGGDAAKIFGGDVGDFAEGFVR
jgi:hypothetical protein